MSRLRPLLLPSQPRPMPMLRLTLPVLRLVLKLPVPRLFNKSISLKQNSRLAFELDWDFCFFNFLLYNLSMINIIAYPDIFIGLLLAVLFGALLGIERNLAGKTAGMRTYALVSLGSALFVDISRLVIAQAGPAGLNYDPLRLAAQIVTGIGFIGAGLVVLHGNRLTGVTTAAGLWVSAGVGMACGFGLYTLALFAVGLSLVIFTVMWMIEKNYIQDDLAKKLGRIKVVKEANANIDDRET